MRRRWVVGLSALALGIGAGVVRFVGVPVTTTEPWINAWIASPSARSLTVWTAGQHEPAGECGAPQVRFEVHETATEIDVTALGTRTEGAIQLVNGMPSLPSGICPAVAWAQTFATLELARPVGDRRIVDVGAGHARVALDASTATTIDGLPAGMRTTDVVAQALGKVHVILRTWAGRARGVDERVDLTTTIDGDLPRLSGGTPRSVDGTPVRMSVERGSRQDAYYLQWRLPSGAQANLSVYRAHGTSTPEQVLDLVRTTREAGG